MEEMIKKMIIAYECNNENELAEKLNINIDILNAWKLFDDSINKTIDDTGVSFKWLVEDFCPFNNGSGSVIITGGKGNIGIINNFK